MNKKIILKESQYKRIVSLLFENSKFYNILNNIKPKDILNIIDENGNEHKFEINSINNNILIGVDEGGLDFELDINDYNDVNREINFNIINPNTKQPINVKIKVKDIEILGDENISSDYEDSHDITNTDYDNNDKKFKNYYIDILKDPDLKKAFYTAPTLWNYFISALKKKSARGTGIFPAYELINKYYKRKIDQKFPGFTNKENKRATFYLFDDIEIPYYQMKDENIRKIMTLEHGYRRATVRQYEAGLGDVKVLTYGSSGGNYGYKIIVKKETGDKPDEYFCDIYVNNNKTEENKFKKTNIRIKFLNSEGYVSHNTSRKNINNK